MDQINCVYNMEYNGYNLVYGVLAEVISFLHTKIGTTNLEL